MKHIKRLLTVSIILILLIMLIGQVFAATSPLLGAAETFLVMGGETVTNTGTTVVHGDVGVSPGSTVEDFPPGITTAPYTVHENDAEAIAAKADFKLAYDALSSPPNETCTGVDNNFMGLTKDLAGLTLAPGVYCADAFILTDTLTLDNVTDPEGVWIFQSSTSLITSPYSSVQFLDDYVNSSCNVWWQVGSSATIDERTDFIGNILAYNSVSLLDYATLEGRAFADIGQVSMIYNEIFYPVCNFVAPTPTTGPGSPTSTPGPVSPGLPETGSGAFILNEVSFWSLVFVGGVLAIALFFGAQSLRKADRPKK